MDGRSAGMRKFERSIVSMLARRFRSRAVVELENLALRHQLRFAPARKLRTVNPE